jgi:predicted sulfurtransferase
VNIVALKPKTRDLKDALETIDDLRKAVESGQVVAFCAVGIEPDDTTIGWCSCTENVTRLRLMGAVASLQARIHADEFG